MSFWVLGSGLGFVIVVVVVVSLVVTKIMVELMSNPYGRVD